MQADEETQQFSFHLLNFGLGGPCLSNRVAADLTCLTLTGVNNFSSGQPFVILDATVFGFKPFIAVH